MKKNEVRFDLDGFYYDLPRTPAQVAVVPYGSVWKITATSQGGVQFTMNATYDGAISALVDAWRVAVSLRSIDAESDFAEVCVESHDMKPNTDTAAIQLPEGLKAILRKEFDGR